MWKAGARRLRVERHAQILAAAEQFGLVKKGDGAGMERLCRAEQGGNLGVG
jgi:hypothetical protein